MNKKFKETLTENLGNVEITLNTLLNTKGSVTDICEVDPEILQTATSLHEMIKNYRTHLSGEDFTRPAIIAYRRPIRYGRP